MDRQPMTLREWNRKIRKNKKRRNKTERKPYTLYALKLENGYWYVGITVNMEARYKQHSTGTGAWWTRVHKPVAIHETRATEIKSQKLAAKLEDAMTLDYADKYGNNKVRGGQYCRVFPRWPEKEIF